MKLETKRAPKNPKCKPPASARDSFTRAVFTRHDWNDKGACVRCKATRNPRAK